MNTKTIDAIIIIGILLFALIISLSIFSNRIIGEDLPVAYSNKEILTQSDFPVNENIAPLSSVQQDATADYLIPYEIDVAAADEGLLKIRIRDRANTKMKLLVQKGTEKYSYTIGQKNEEYFPLQMGSGQYTIKILENVGGTNYRLAENADIICEIADPNAVFLHSTQIINWNPEMAVVKKARAMTALLGSQEDKVKAIARYITNNYSYDWDKINKVDNAYLPNLEEIYSQKKGICYDYASLLAAMTRSVGIPSRLCMGYSELIEGYHAWNEVYLNGEWHVIDTTVDAQYYEKNQSYTLFKNIGQYQASRVY